MPAAIASAAVLLLATLGGCRPPVREFVTLTFLDPEWSHDSQEHSPLSEQALQEFTRQTGIHVNHLPAPESSPAQLALTRDLLKKGAVTPDVYGIDVIWPGILSEYLLDLKNYFASELASDDPEMVANYTVKSKLVAMPYHANIGVLFYRTDLLTKYGYRDPPKTWDELGKMSARIQDGERAKGAKDFWGFVWEGAASEGLTCDGLEWQVAEGGGRIIETDGRISVNNPNAIRAWERAAHWVGWISPPSVLSYQEWDAANAFWNSGRAAFFRGWTSDFFLSDSVEFPVTDRSGVTSLPAGNNARVGALGGFGLAISRTSKHPAQAVELVRFLLSREAREDQARAHSEAPRRPIQYELPPVLKAYSHGSYSGDARGSGIVTRPSTVTGEKYDAVSEAYFRTLHAVLEGKTKAPEAAAALAKELAKITGLAPTP